MTRFFTEAMFVLYASVNYKSSKKTKNTVVMKLFLMPRKYAEECSADSLARLLEGKY